MCMCIHDYMISKPCYTMCIALLGIILHIRIIPNKVNAIHKPEYQIVHALHAIME